MEQVIDDENANKNDKKEYNSADARILKSGLEQLCDKMEILSKVCL